MDIHIKAKNSVKEVPFGQALRNRAWPCVSVKVGRSSERKSGEKSSIPEQVLAKEMSPLLVNTRESSPVRDTEANENFNKEMIWKLGKSRREREMVVLLLV